MYEKVTAKRNFTRPYTPCDDCGRTFRYVGKLEKHKAKHIEEINSQKAIEKLEQTGTRVFTCLRCHIKFLDIKKLHTHRDYLCTCPIDTVDTIWTCESCGKKFDNEKGLSIHKGWCQSFTADRDVPVIQCDECGKTCENDHQLKLHKRIHVVGTDYMCAECNKPFKSQKSLDVHMSIHTGTQRYQCKECPKKYNTRAALLTHHQTSHVRNGVKYFQCDVCGKRYVNKHVLKRHQNVHSDVSAHCNHCGRKYKEKRYLARHKCIKRAEFLCHNCGKAFKLEQTLKKHQSTCSTNTQPDKHGDSSEQPTSGEQTTTEQSVTEQTTEQTTAVFDLLMQAAGLTDEVTIKSNSAADGAVSETVTVIMDSHSHVLEETTSAADGAVSETVTVIMDNHSPVLEEETTSAAAVIHEEPAEQVLWQCSSCGIHFEEMENVQKHVKSCKKEADVDTEKIEASTDEQYSCVECPEVFIDIRACMQHIQGHRKRQCENCYKECMDDAALQEHQQIECQMSQGSSDVINDSTMGKHTCSYCGRKCVSDEVLERHQEFSEKKAATQGNDVKCLYCPRHFTKHCELVEHSRCYRYTCKGCYVHYRHMKAFTKHVRLSHRAGHCCRHCKQHFKSVAELEDHINYATKLTDTINLKCFQCGMQFSDKLKLEKHSADYKSCKLCGRHFPSSNHLTSHLKSEHERTKQDEVKEQSSGNVCKHCNVTFVTVSELGVHIKQVLKDTGTLACAWERDTITCLRCGANYNEHWKLMKHFKQWKYNCQECNRHFRWERQLWQHLQSAKHNQDVVVEGCKEEEPWIEEEEPWMEGDAGEKDKQKIKAVPRHDKVEERTTEKRSVVNQRKQTRGKDRISSDDKVHAVVKRRRLGRDDRRKTVLGVTYSSDDAKTSSDDATTSSDDATTSVGNDDEAETNNSSTAKKNKSSQKRTTRYGHQVKTNQIACRYCPLMYRTTQHMQIHIKNCHEKSKDRHWTNLGSGKSQCDFCQKVFSRLRGVTYHIHKSMKDIGASGSVQCVNCGDMMTAKCQVDKHAKTCGKVREPRPDKSDDAYMAQELSSPGCSEDEDCSDDDPATAQQPIGIVDDGVATLNKGNGYDLELIALNPDVFYKVKFPAGTLAKVVFTEGEKYHDHENHLQINSSKHTVTTSRRGKKNASCVVPVISLESVTNTDIGNESDKADIGPAPNSSDIVNTEQITDSPVTRSIPTSDTKKSEQSKQLAQNKPRIHGVKDEMSSEKVHSVACSTRSNSSPPDSTRSNASPPDSTRSNASPPYSTRSNASPPDSTRSNASPPDSTRSNASPPDPSGSMDISASNETTISASTPDKAAVPPRITSKGNNLLISVPDDTVVSMSPIVAVGNTKIISCTFTPAQDGCEGEVVNVPMPGGYEVHNVCSLYNQRSDVTVYSIVLTDNTD